MHIVLVLDIKSSVAKAASMPWQAQASTHLIRADACARQDPCVHPALYGHQLHSTMQVKT